MLLKTLKSEGRLSVRQIRQRDHIDPQKGPAMILDRVTIADLAQMLEPHMGPTSRATS